MLRPSITCSRLHQILGRFRTNIGNHGLCLSQLLPERLKAIDQLVCRASRQDHALLCANIGLGAPVPQARHLLMALEELKRAFALVSARLLLRLLVLFLVVFWNASHD